MKRPTPPESETIVEGIDLPEWMILPITLCAGGAFMIFMWALWGIK